MQRQFYEENMIYVSGFGNPVSKAIYEEANDLVEKWSKIIASAFTRITAPGLMLPYIIMSYFMYFTTDSGTDAFVLPFLAKYHGPILLFSPDHRYECIFYRLPFEWRHPVVYLFAFSYESATVFYVTTICACNFTFIAGSGWFISAFTRDIQLELFALKEETELEWNMLKVNEKLRNFIELHQIAKQLRFYQYHVKTNSIMSHF